MAVRHSGLSGGNVVWRSVRRHGGLLARERDDSLLLDGTARSDPQGQAQADLPAFPLTLNRSIVSVSFAAATERCCVVVVSSLSDAICCSVAADVCSAPCAAVSAIPATSSMRRTTSRM